VEKEVIRNACLISQDEPVRKALFSIVCDERMSEPARREAATALSGFRLNDKEIKGLQEQFDLLFKSSDGDPALLVSLAETLVAARPRCALDLLSKLEMETSSHKAARSAILKLTHSLGYILFDSEIIGPDGKTLSDFNSEDLHTNLKLNDKTAAEEMKAARRKCESLLSRQPSSSTKSPEPEQLDWLSIPKPQWHGAPAALLRAEYDIVPFHGRGSDISGLRKWVLNQHKYIAQLLTGNGGMGKTRLARELCLQLRSNSIRCGFINLQEIEQCFSYLKSCTDEPMLLVIDYAETAVEENVARILWILTNRNLRLVRLLLLARRGGYWWRRLKLMCDSIGARINREPRELSPLSIDAEKRRESYVLASKAFAKKLDVAEPSSMPKDLMAEHYKRALLLHMSALLATQHIKSNRSDMSALLATQRIKTDGSEAILEQILLREIDYWARQLERRQLPIFLVDGFWRAMGVISLKKGVQNKHEAVRVIGNVGFFRGQPTAVLEGIADTLHDCYPGDSNHDPLWIEPIQPDTLKDYLIAKGEAESPDDFR
jgi:hypothetical protein